MQRFVLPDCFYLILLFREIFCIFETSSCFDHENLDLGQLFTRNLDGDTNSSVGILLPPESEIHVRPQQSFK